MSEYCQWLHEKLQDLPVMQFPFEKTRLPDDGIYFFYEEGEHSGHSGQPRIVRIGTHRDGNFRSRIADHFLSDGRRLDLHVNKPAPKDRSIFRKQLGRALLAKDKDPYLEVWNIDFTTRRNRQTYGNRRNLTKERDIEEEVSRLLREKFSFRCLELELAVARMGSAGLEAALIGTVANCGVCKPSPTWLGLHSPKLEIRQSGLWLVQHLKSRPIDEIDMKAVTEALTRLSSIAFSHSGRSDQTTGFTLLLNSCPACSSDKIMFPDGDKSTKTRLRGIAWRCSECGCGGHSERLYRGCDGRRVRSWGCLNSLRHQHESANQHFMTSASAGRW
jgi:hypothetical protein